MKFIIPPTSPIFLGLSLLCLFQGWWISTAAFLLRCGGLCKLLPSSGRSGSLSMREAKHQVKYIHIGCGLAGFLIPVIAHMASFAQRVQSDPSTDFLLGGLGFTIVRFPPIPCHGSTKDIIFYATLALCLLLESHSSY